MIAGLRHDVGSLLVSLWGAFERFCVPLEDFESGIVEYDSKIDVYKREKKNTRRKETGPWLWVIF